MVAFCKFTSFFLLLIAGMAFGSQSYVQCLSALTLSAIFHGLRHLYARQQRKEAEQEASAPSKEDNEVDATPRA